jgi:hypothetical protein
MTGVPSVLTAEAAALALAALISERLGFQQVKLSLCQPTADQLPP